MNVRSVEKSPATPNRRLAAASHVAERLEAGLRNCRTFPTEVSCSFDGVDPLRWVSAQPTAWKVFWSGRDDEEDIAACGVARSLRPGRSERIADVIRVGQSLLACLPDARMFGGMAFQARELEPLDPWTLFGDAQFWLPRVRCAGGRLSVVVMDEADLSQATEAVRSLGWDFTQGQEVEPVAVSRVDDPSRSRWRELVTECLALFEEEVLEKIVLVRRCRLTLDRPAAPLEMLRRLRLLPHAAFHFCIQIDPSTAFLSTSPERLFRRVGRKIESEIIAGTRGRDADAAADGALSQALLVSGKDQLEHDIVRKSIRQRLHRCVDELAVDARASVLRLSSTQHLLSRVHGHLKPGIGDADLLERLHPTPALGGYPTENALAEIARLEPFPRGWYGAPVGWIRADSAEFAVAIRSALVHDRNVDLYSGAGIVPGSHPDLEWHELEQKIQDMLTVFDDGPS